MNRFLLSLIFAATLMFASCRYDDSDIWDKLNDYEGRLAALEERCDQMNDAISSLRSIIKALEENDYVTSVVPVSKNGAVIGYTITFTKSEPITIYHGEDGKDGYTPLIGVAQDADGFYYWTIDGEWVVDAKGNKVKAEGENGEEGTTPRLKIEGYYWFVSYDNGESWSQLGKATGEDGDSMFSSVTQDEENVYLTLADGSVITLPKYDKKDITNLLKRIQSVSYIPTHSDGKATVEYNSNTSSTTLHFEISPKDAIKDLADIWQNVVSVKAIYTETRAIQFIDMPIIEFEADATNGVISVTISCENLSAEFFTGEQEASVRLAISDGNSSVMSDYIPLTPKEMYISNSELWYTNGSTTEPSIPYRVDIFGANIESNSYDSEKECWILKFDGDVTLIGSKTFYNCNELISVTIPNSTISIESSAFEGCSSLTSITIPGGVAKIGENAFLDCTSLTSVYCKGITPPVGSSYMFSYRGSNGYYYPIRCTIYVPHDSVSAYKEAAYWSLYASDIAGYDF